MAQISIFDKTRHYSDKDFTCSIGKNDVIYITFRNNSWLRFTDSECIAVCVKTTKKGSVLRFGDPDKRAPGAVFKLGFKKDDHESRKHTRYLQINGKHYPEILEIVRHKSGSYDFGPDSVHVEKPKRQRKPQDIKLSEIDAIWLSIHDLEKEYYENALTRIVKLEERITKFENLAAFREATPDWKAKLLETINSL